MSGIKYDQNKPQMDLVPGVAIEEIAKVLTFGAVKYTRGNWMGGISYSRVIAAALRHFYAWIRGQDLDEETGLSHLAHLGACVCFLIWYSKYRPDLDDRLKDTEYAKSTVLP